MSAKLGVRFQGGVCNLTGEIHANSKTLGYFIRNVQDTTPYTFNAFMLMHILYCTPHLSSLASPQHSPCSKGFDQPPFLLLWSPLSWSSCQHCNKWKRYTYINSL